jgi:hypothetical protein
VLGALQQERMARGCREFHAADPFHGAENRLSSSGA